MAMDKAPIDIYKSLTDTRAGINKTVACLIAGQTSA
jgi:hypothetical protein